MDCNSYSYTPHMLDEGPAPQRQKVNAVTIERRTANGHDYFSIITGDGWTTAHDLQTAIRTAENWLREGV